MGGGPEMTFWSWDKPTAEINQQRWDKPTDRAQRADEKIELSRTPFFYW